MGIKMAAIREAVACRPALASSGVQADPTANSLLLRCNCGVHNPHHLDFAEANCPEFLHYCLILLVHLNGIYGKFSDQSGKWSMLISSLVLYQISVWIFCFVWEQDSKAPLKRLFVLVWLLVPSLWRGNECSRISLSIQYSLSTKGSYLYLVEDFNTCEQEYPFLK